MAEKGKYIVIEGGESVGKSTQVQILAPSIGALAIREPGGTVLGENIRSIMLNPEITKSLEAEVLMHAAQRAELVNEVIDPTLEQGKHVVSDRSWVSSVAYQGALGESFENIFDVNAYALGIYIKPDLTIVLDADPEVVAVRNDGSNDYYERMNMEFHNYVRSTFLKLAGINQWPVINAEFDKDTIAAEIRSIVQDQLGI